MDKYSSIIVLSLVVVKHADKYAILHLFLVITE